LHDLIVAYLAAVDDFDRHDEDLPFRRRPELRHLLHAARRPAKGET
jgi:hypothetical protein